jgi:outer membrane lipoprotein-sorting protein
MKKNLFLILLVLCLFLVGCGKNSTNSIKSDLISSINNLKAYEVKGKLEVVNNDDVFNYDVMVDYRDKDFYKVSLKNIANNHEQIILRNDDGVYVMTHKSLTFLK